MPTVERTQISLDAAQAARLRRLARERHTSMAALIRDAVERVYPVDNDDSIGARWERALAAIGGFASTDPKPAGDEEWYDDEYVASIYDRIHPPETR